MDVCGTFPPLCLAVGPLELCEDGMPGAEKEELAKIGERGILHGALFIATFMLGTSAHFCTPACFIACYL